MAVAAFDLAEVIGTVIGLNLLFGLPLLVGLVLTGLVLLLPSVVGPLSYVVAAAMRLLFRV